MTKKLFWQDPYRTECTAEVTAIRGNKVKLNQTIFFAFSGGQESDSGTIGGVKVIEAVKQGDKESIIDIEYVLEKEPPFSVGKIVEVKIDSEKRRKLRNLHSAAHLLYYIIIEKIGKVRIVGSNVASEKARMDFEYNQPLVEILPEIESTLNKFIEENHKIVMEDDAEKKDLRWWTCNQWKMPCGGTHVRTTAEIGSVQLKRVNKGSGKKRIEIYLTE